MRRIMPAVLAALALLSTPALAENATKVEIVVPADAPKTEARDDVGDVAVTWDNGRREVLTKGAHAEQPKIGPDGLIGWTWSKEMGRELWINEHLRVQRGKQLLFEVKSEKPFIEEWNFIAEGVAVTSRAMHGPAIIELFSIKDGKRIATSKAYGEVPAWAKPFAND